MATLNRSTARRPPAGPTPMLGIFLLLWLAFAAALIFDRGALDSIWQWIRDLPLAAEVIVWVVLLPLVAGLWIWESDWSLGLRLSLIIIVAIANLIVLGPKSRREDVEITGDEPGVLRGDPVAESGQVQTARQDDDREMPPLRPSREEQYY
ncbi:MAG TPA: hypothetical protein VIL01_03710 [Thermomicrobiales bacterium]